MAKTAGDIKLTSFVQHGTENAAFDFTADRDVTLEVKNDYEVRVK